MVGRLQTGEAFSCGNWAWLQLTASHPACLANRGFAGADIMPSLCNTEQYPRLIIQWLINPAKQSLGVNCSAHQLILPLGNSSKCRIIVHNYCTHNSISSLELTISTFGSVSSLPPSTILSKDAGRQAVGTGIVREGNSQLF